jgi:hypothetical protein
VCCKNPSGNPYYQVLFWTSHSNQYSCAVFCSMLVTTDTMSSIHLGRRVIFAALTFCSLDPRQTCVYPCRIVRSSVSARRRLYSPANLPYCIWECGDLVAMLFVRSDIWRTNPYIQLQYRTFVWTLKTGGFNVAKVFSRGSHFSGDGSSQGKLQP